MYAIVFSGPDSHVTQCKSLEIYNMLYYNKKNPVKLKHCETSSSYRILDLMKLKPQKER